MASESDSFSFNPKHLDDWPLPPELNQTLPPRLSAELEGWQAAGAAVSTTLQRLDRFDSEALYRGWPIKRTEHLSRTPSTSASGAQTPMSTQSPVASFGIAEAPHPVRLPRLVTSLSNASNMSTSSEAVVDTPPFTPEDTNSHPFGGHSRSARVSIDPMQLNDRLEPLTEHQAFDFATSSPPVTASPAPLSPPVLPQFDEASWEVFVNQYTAELDNLRQHEIVRFRHIRRGIEKMCLEMDNEDVNAATTWKDDFSKWWIEMGMKQEAVEKQVQDLEVPDLEQIKLERVAIGLVI